MHFSKIIAGTMKWGIWGARFSTSDYEQIIRESLDVGVTSFDHADIYGGYTTEAEFGAVLRQNPSLRNEIQLITKCGIRMLSANRPQHAIKYYDTSAAHIINSVENSLRNFHTDYLDVLLIHRPDFLLDADEVAAAFARLKQQGKVLHFGVSNFTSAQLSLLHSRFPVEVHQIECSLLHLDPFWDGTLDQCQQLGIVPMAWGPLGSGNLFSTNPEPAASRIRKVAEELASVYQTDADVLLLAWLLKHPSGIFPVTGTTKSERIRRAVAAAEIQMNREDWYKLWTAATGAEVP